MRDADLYPREYPTPVRVILHLLAGVGLGVAASLALFAVRVAAR